MFKPDPFGSVFLGIKSLALTFSQHTEFCMQAHSPESFVSHDERRSGPYTRAAMRKSDLSRERPPLAQRLVELRQQAGLTQTELAEAVGVAVSNIAFWELKGTPPRGEVLPALAKALGVSVDEILGVSAPRPKPAAKGRLQLAFDAAAKLPRRQQAKVAEFVEAFVAQQQKAG
jgi:transcriptional regulator with XRE-family HTH domain